MVANSALDVVTVNGRDAPKWKFWAENRKLWMCLVENPNQKCFIIIFILLNTIK